MYKHGFPSSQSLAIYNNIFNNNNKLIAWKWKSILIYEVSSDATTPICLCLMGTEVSRCNRCVSCVCIVCTVCVLCESSVFILVASGGEEIGSPGPTRMPWMAYGPMHPFSHGPSIHPSAAYLFIYVWVVGSRAFNSWQSGVYQAHISTTHALSKMVYERH